VVDSNSLIVDTIFECYRCHISQLIQRLFVYVKNSTPVCQKKVCFTDSILVVWTSCWLCFRYSLCLQNVCGSDHL